MLSLMYRMHPTNIWYVIRLYQFLCLCVHFFKVLDVLFLYHEDLGQSCLVMKKKNKTKQKTGHNLLEVLEGLGCHLLVFCLTVNIYHLDQELDRKSSQSISLSTEQFVPPWWLIDKRVIVLLREKKDNGVINLHKQSSARDMQFFLKTCSAVAVWCTLVLTPFHLWSSKLKLNMI